MDPDYDPAAGFARATEMMAQNQRLGLRLQAYALTLLVLSLLGTSVLL